MKDEQDGSAYGRTNWRRFALAVAVPTAVTGAVLFGMANGAIAAQVSVAGKPFKISADKLEGKGFVQYGRAVEDASGNKRFVATSAISYAELTNLCQSVRVDGLPISLIIRAGNKGEDAVATNMIIDMTELRGEATFTDINIGQDASTLQGGGGPDAHGEKGSFGQQAGRVEIRKLQQVSLFTSAGSFKLAGLDLKVDFDGKPEECFDTAASS